MKKRDLSDLAQKTNVSKATISRALNHCPGVDHETRRRVLEAAGPLSPSSSEDDMVMILPDTPRYFWNPAFIELQAAFAAASTCIPGCMIRMRSRCIWIRRPGTGPV